MKIYDQIKIIKSNEQYESKGLSIGMIGSIIQAEIRNNTFYVVFIDKHYSDENFFLNDENIKEIQDDIFCAINITDMEVVKESKITDDKILAELPKQDPGWWCKVEDGYILNLLGEKKNKIPYDYNS